MDDDGCLVLIMLVAGVALIVFIVWLIVQIAAVVAACAAGAGVCYGAGLACRNYALSFKRNIVDSNS